jgi:HicB family
MCHSGAKVAHMDLRPYIDEIHDQLEAAAEGGGEAARALAERLIAPLDAAIRLSLLDALAAAAQEITSELAPGSVEVRLRGRDPEFVVTTPTEPAGDDQADEVAAAAVDVSAAAGSLLGDEGGMARINLRMPDHLKSRIDRAAAGQGISINAWLVRAAAAVLEHTDPSGGPGRRSPQGSRRFTGWAR